MNYDLAQNRHINSLQLFGYTMNLKILLQPIRLIWWQIP